MGETRSGRLKSHKEEVDRESQNRLNKSLLGWEKGKAPVEDNGLHHTVAASRESTVSPTLFAMRINLIHKSGEKPIKYLGKWYDKSLRDQKNPQQRKIQNLFASTWSAPQTM